MAFTLDDVERLLQEREIVYNRNENDSITVYYRTQRYRDSDGDPSLMLLFCASEDDGSFIVCAPHAFRATGLHVAKIYEALLAAQWVFRWVRFRLDCSDGEIRPTIDIPVFGGTLSEQAFDVAVSALLGVVNDFYPVYKQASEGGVISFPDEDDERIELRSVLERLQFSFEEDDGMENEARAVRYALAQIDKVHPDDEDAAPPVEV